LKHRENFTFIFTLGIGRSLRRARRRWDDNIKMYVK
jgi:hypothetical protein